ncbi:hypothetical protein SAMN05443637_105171 [Pseudonocardia thermophila]|uniref:Uncharacterized protein n=1 Tax=Pseudonocardia thermophila TaxID=1848 RepID=A0A1M6RUW8_PSETH|nr:hypothetical protein [Pseudonocardia thermophila]SHK36291.1 hypothetical protein SAMN05443637_105171 [Pseudonocardia thermophila]
MGPTTVMPPRHHDQRAPQPSETPTQAPAKTDLTISKVLAVAGAGATSAFLGSWFGVAGTVLGAAIGAVATTVATSIYQRSIDRARSVVTARLRPQSPGDPDELDTVVMAAPAPPGDQATELIAPADVPRTSRRRTAGYFVATVLGFALALAAVTGVEALKGSTLWGGEPSVGRVLQGGSPESATPTADPSDADSTDSSDDDQDDGDSRRTQHDRNWDVPPSDDATEPTTRPTPQPTPTPEPQPSGGVLPDLIGGGGTNGGPNNGGQDDAAAASRSTAG